MTSPRLPSAPDNISSPRESTPQGSRRSFVGWANLLSSFHVIGEHLDRVYDQASVTSPPVTTVQTTPVAPGAAALVELNVEVPGRFLLVDHALSRLEHGLLGFLQVEGPANPEVFHEGGVPTH